MKILISCYACSPYKGSEPGMGWNFVRCLAGKHELHVVTEYKFKEHLDKYFAEHPDEAKYYKFYYIKRIRSRFLRTIWPPSYYWFYNLWQRRVYKFVKQLDLIEKFDILHHLNMAGYREPGYLYRLDKPFIWGPIGGFDITPWKLLHTLGVYGAIFFFCRNWVNIFQMHYSRRVHYAMKKSNVLISATQGTKDIIKKIYNRESIIIPEVGLISNCIKIDSIKRRDLNDKLKIVWCGLHIPRKALNLIIKALAECKYRVNIELHVIGEGQYTEKWKKLASNLGISSNIVWHGWVPRDKALVIMQSCHCMAISSLSDLTSTVILEALSNGLPVVALDHCGFSNVLNKSCGIKIKVRTEKEIVNDFANAFDTIFLDENNRYEMSKGALLRSLDFSWEKKAELLDELYNKSVKI